MNQVIKLIFPLFALVIALTTASAADKAEQKKLVIPDYPTAKDQFSFALAYAQAQVISPDAKRRHVQIGKIMQAFEKVIANFPADTSVVPRTFLELGDCAATDGDLKKARQYYQTALAKYPNDDYIQARGTFSIGRLQDVEGNHEDAKLSYKEVMDRFGTSQLAAVRDIAKKASRGYYQVQEQPRKPAKKESVLSKLWPFKDSGTNK